jgi:cardiolipin synthase
MAMQKWDQVTIFNNGDQYFQSLIEDIRIAKKSITIETYIFSLDELTRNILEELGKARSRGVDVKIIVDGFGSYFEIPTIQQICDRKNIELRVFHPLARPMMWLLGSPFFSNPFWRRMNRRTHRKITIFDEQKAYLGSLNFSGHHVGKYAWRDTGLSVKGPAVATLIVAFHVTYLRTFQRGIVRLLSRYKWLNAVDPVESPLRLNTTIRMRQKIYKDLLRRLRYSQKRIYITTAYFLPKRSILGALIQAARRGVDVRILIPGKSDVPFVKWAAFHILKVLTQKGVRIFEYQKSILHAKTMIIDDEGFIGSFNLNHRSLLHDLEVEVLLKDPESLKIMQAQWLEDIENAREVGTKEYTPSSILIRMIHKLAFKLRYML